MITNYSDIQSSHHRSIREALFERYVIVEEKIDGSQFSFRLGDDGLEFKSHRARVYPETAGMFKAGTDGVAGITSLLHPNWTYRGEYLSKPHHNALTYDRVPTHNVILYDIQDENGDFLYREEKETEASRIGLEVVPLLARGAGLAEVALGELLTLPSCLGGMLEGIVIKPALYDVFDAYKHVLMGKIVSDRFKEIHSKNSFPKESKGEIVQTLIARYRTTPRWDKAVIHLAEAGTLTRTPKDIGSLIKEVQTDVLKEETEEIKEQLFNHFKRLLLSGITSGLPEWYLGKLDEENGHPDNVGPVEVYEQVV